MTNDSIQDIADYLRDRRVVYVEANGGKIVIGEMCDYYYREEITPQQCRDFGRYLIRMASKVDGGVLE